jgi:hypothetical protein
MTPRSLLWRSLLWVAGSAIGAVVVALPDSGERVLSLSRTHGPSPLDLVGVVILVGAWLPVAVSLPYLWRATKGVPAGLAAGLGFTGAVGLVVTIAADLGWLWLAAAGALVGAQVVLLADQWRVAGRQPQPRM